MKLTAIRFASRLLLPLLCANISYSANEPKSKQIEEIIVTAQKRAESAIDVPISMSVIGDNFIAEQGLTDIQDVLLFAPNMKVDSTSYYGGPRCRGLTTNADNRAFEPPCGVAIDGVPYTRTPYFSAAVFDIARVEVLRGPQGTTFGKNTTAGLIHMVTQQPSEEFSASVDYQNGDLNRRRIELAVGGELIDDWLEVRVAGVRESKDGYIRNTYADINPTSIADNAGREREGYRIKLRAPDIKGFTVGLGYEDIDLDAIGSTLEANHMTAEQISYLRGFDPNFDAVKNNFVNSVDKPTEINTAIKTAQLNLDYIVADWDLGFLVADSELTQQLEMDQDLTPSPAFHVGFVENTTTTTAEFKAISPLYEGLFGLDDVFGLDLGSSDLLVGYFWQERDIGGSEGYLQLGLNSYVTLLGLAGEPGGDPGLLDLSVLALVPEVFEKLSVFYAEKSTTRSFFSEFRWYLSEQWTIQQGLRFSEETKEAHWDHHVPETAVLLPVLTFETYVRNEKRSESNRLPKTTLVYEPVQDVKLFLHWSRGFKGGGFNALAFGSDDPVEFGPETVENWGFDVKTRLLDGSLQANLSLYSMDIDDFQVLTVITANGTAFGAEVLNVAEAKTEGAEVDVIYKPLTWLTLIGTLGYNDTEYVHFPINTCPSDRENTDGDEDSRCDSSGMPFPYAPKNNNTLTASVNLPLSEVFSGTFGFLDGLEFMSSLTVEYMSGQFTDISLDDRRYQDSFYRWRGSIGLSNPRQGWSLQLVGENLTDEVTSALEQDGGINWTSAPEPPRQVFAKFKWAY